jgi:hypothetical protein
MARFRSAAQAMARDCAIRFGRYRFSMTVLQTRPAMKAQELIFSARLRLGEPNAAASIGATSLYCLEARRCGLEALDNFPSNRVDRVKFI